MPSTGDAFDELERPCPPSRQGPSGSTAWKMVSLHDASWQRGTPIDAAAEAPICAESQ